MYQYGDYTYPQSIILDVAREVSAKQRTAETASGDGVYSAATADTGYREAGALAARVFVVSGHLLLSDSQTLDDLDTLWDAFLLSHAPGVRRALFTGRNDRYLSAEVQAIREVDARNYTASQAWEVRFLSASGVYAATTLSTATLAMGENNITAGGTAPAPSQVVLSVAGVDTSKTQVLTVTLSGTSAGGASWSRAFTLSGFAANDTFTVDTEKQRVTASSGADKTELFSGAWWRLQPGAQKITIAQTGGLSLGTTKRVDWRNRWL